MAALRTNISRLLNIRTPIIAAPMAGASGGALAAQVTLGGGFGLLAAGYESATVLRRELDLARAVLPTAAGSPLRIGVGFLGWKLDEPSGDGAELLSLSLENRVTAVWLAFGHNLGRWVDFVRKFDTDRDDGHRTIVFILVNTMEEAQTAVNEWKADVLVAQGIESGGHGSASAPPLLAFVPELLRAFPSGPPLLAAGGLASGGHVAALLTLGASGAALGTRFLLTPEAQYTPAQKDALRAARATVRTRAFDAARGTLGWPAGIDGRGLRNGTVRDVEGGVPLDEVRARFRAGVERGDAERMVVWAGTGVGLMDEVKGAADVVRELHNDTVAHLRMAYDLLDNSSQ